MAFYEDALFPSCIAIRSTGGAGWSTGVVVLNSGHEQRNQPWSQARRTYEVSQVPQPLSTFDLLQQHFDIVEGMTHGFRMHDPRDFEAVAGRGFFRLLTATTFQMVKRSTSGANIKDRDIRKPVNGTIFITGGAGVTVNYATGVVTVSGGTPSAWVGKFDVPCRFGTDQMQADILDRQPGDGGELLIQWSAIPILEIRV